MAAEGVWVSVRAINVTSATAHMKEEPTNQRPVWWLWQLIEALWKSVQCVCLLLIMHASCYCCAVLCYVAPHQPRLDWQMFHAATFGSYQQNPWFLNLVYRLLMNEQDGLCVSIWCFGCNDISACRLLILLHWWFVKFYNCQWLYWSHQFFAPCTLQGYKNRPAPFPGRMLCKAIKPGFLCVVS